MSEQITESAQMNNDDSAFVRDSDAVGDAIKSVPRPAQNIGLDTNDTLFKNMIYAGESSFVDMAALESFTSVAQSREQVYQLIDSMCTDPTIAAVLEAYAEDATEYNDQGRIVWAESTDADVSKYITFLLDTLNVDKKIYSWVYSLCKYGDLYLRLYRESDLKDDLFNDDGRSTLNEQVNVIAYRASDKFGNYIEKVPNPAEMFELTKFGKTYGYIKADVNSISKENNWIAPTYRYSFKQKDVDIYSAKEFVHAYLDDGANRTPEEVSIFTTPNGTTGKEEQYTYTVQKGQSLLYTVFKIWRELMLLKNSILLNRVTKSSIVRVIGIEVGDMEKADVEHRTRAIKNLIEQKTAINKNESINEYTNPGPIENNIYVPTRNGMGAITTSQIGGDVDVKSLADLDFFNNAFFGALRVPKQYFGFTDDGAGFNGGQSLSIISSRYAKMVKRIQNTVIQSLTDMVNILLIDRGLGNYINKFQLHMVPPTTQEEIDRRDNTSSKVQLARDILDIMSNSVDSPDAKLRILKLLMANVITDTEIIDILQEQIDALESDNIDGSVDDGEDDDDIVDRIDVNVNDSEGSTRTSYRPSQPPAEDSFDDIDNADSGEGQSPLPSPTDLGMDFTDNGQF